MLKYVESPPFDLSRLDSEDFQVALRVALNDLRDHETVFEQFLSEAGHPDKSDWPRTVQYSHLHLLFAQTIVSTLLAESDRRIITRTIWQPQIGAATSAALTLAQGRLQKSEVASCEPTAPIVEFRNRERIVLPHLLQRNHARIDRKHQIGFAISGASITRRRWIVNDEPVPPDAAGCLEPHFRWSQAVHWEFRARLIRAASGKLAHRDDGDRST
jgi:hypothetical protein